MGSVDTVNDERVIRLGSIFSLERHKASKG